MSNNRHRTINGHYYFDDYFDETTLTGEGIPQWVVDSEKLLSFSEVLASENNVHRNLEELQTPFRLNRNLAETIPFYRHPCDVEKYNHSIVCDEAGIKRVCGCFICNTHYKRQFASSNFQVDLPKHQFDSDSDKSGSESENSDSEESVVQTLTGLNQRPNRLTGTIECLACLGKQNKMAYRLTRFFRTSSKRILFRKSVAQIKIARWWRRRTFIKAVNSKPNITASLALKETKKQEILQKELREISIKNTRNAWLDRLEKQGKQAKQNTN